MYVVGKPGNVKGFFQLRLVEDRAEVGIMGVAESAKGTPAALDLMTGMQLDLKALGIRWITAKLSAGNTRIINLVAHFGWRFRNARATFHWHAPDARHLLPPGPIPDEGDQATQYQCVYRIVRSASKSVESTTVPRTQAGSPSASDHARNTGKAGST